MAGSDVQQVVPQPQAAGCAAPDNTGINMTASRKSSCYGITLCATGCAGQTQRSYIALFLKLLEVRQSLLRLVHNCVAPHSQIP